MDKIAYVSGETVIYWTSVILTLAAAVAICFFLAFYLGRCGNAVAGFAVVPLSLALSLTLGRLVHWYCRADSYDSFLTAMTDYSSGGYALVGVFAGCFLAAVVVRLLFLDRNLPQMLDCMSIAGCAGIAVGRLASFYNSSDRGQVVSTIRSLPFVYPVTNAVSGAAEYRLATFVIQAMVAAALFAALSVFYLRSGRRGRGRDGDTCLIFLLIYGASQVVLDSTRYDKLFFRSNGFVSIVQVLGALGLALAIIVFSVRLVKNRGFRGWYVPIWLVQAAAIGGAGYMEYYVQRRGNEAVFAYSVMSACLCLVVALTLLLRTLGLPARRRADDFGG